MNNTGRLQLDVGMDGDLELFADNGATIPFSAMAPGQREYLEAAAARYRKMIELFLVAENVEVRKWRI